MEKNLKNNIYIYIYIHIPTYIYIVYIFLGNWPCPIHKPVPELISLKPVSIIV